MRNEMNEGHEISLVATATLSDFNELSIARLYLNVNISKIEAGL